MRQTLRGRRTITNVRWTDGVRLIADSEGKLREIRQQDKQEERIDH